MKFHELLFTILGTNFCPSGNKAEKVTLKFENGSSYENLLFI